VVVLMSVAMMRVLMVPGFVMTVHGRCIRGRSEINKSTGEHGESQKFFHKIGRRAMEYFRPNTLGSKEICWTRGGVNVFLFFRGMWRKFGRAV
jgi:hypothetical protein